MNELETSSSSFYKEKAAKRKLLHVCKDNEFSTVVGMHYTLVNHESGIEALKQS